MFKSLKGNILTSEELEDFELIVISKRQLKDIQATYEEIGKLQNRLERAVSFIKTNCILSDEWTDLGFCNFAPTGRITYKQLSKSKVQELLDILKGDKNE